MTKQQKELNWYDVTKKTHALFCSCGDAVTHLLKVHQLWMYGYDEWRTGFEETIVGGDGGDPLGDEDIGDGDGAGPGESDEHGEDAAMAAAADDAEQEDERSEP
nr:ORF2 [Epsilontorquevirus sp.]